MLFTESPSGPLLIATRCRKCDYIDFPAQVYGCRNCGSFGGALEHREIGTEGEIQTSAKVHRMSADGQDASFTVAVVHLDAGPVTRVEMVDTQSLTPGTQVVGVVETRGENPELKFQKTGE